MGKLEGAFSPLCSLQALQAGGATVGETTKNRNLTHLILLGTILDTGFFLNILDIGYFLKTYWILSEYALDSWILSETYRIFSKKRLDQITPVQALDCPTTECHRCLLKRQGKFRTGLTDSSLVQIRKIRLIFTSCRHKKPLVSFSSLKEKDQEGS